MPVLLLRLMMLLLRMVLLLLLPYRHLKVVRTARALFSK